jgi:cell division protein FtsQ
MMRPEQNDPVVTQPEPPMAVTVDPPPVPNPVDQTQPEVEVEGVDEPVGGPIRAAHVANPARRRALRPWLIAASVVLVLGSIAFGLTYTPLFRADQIRIRGEAHLSEAKILKVAGLGPATNLLHADLAGAQRRLEQEPWIARASVSRSLPHGLDIQVVERVPVATTVSGGRRVLVSIEGVVLGNAGNVSGFPVVLSPEGSEDLSLDELRAGGRVATAMPTGLRAQVDAITVDGDGAIVVRTGSGVLVTYGDDTQLQAKAQSLKAVLAWAARGGESLATVDVTVPGSPTAGLTGGPVVERWFI